MLFSLLNSFLDMACSHHVNQLQELVPASSVKITILKFLSYYTCTCGCLLQAYHL